MRDALNFFALHRGSSGKEDIFREDKPQHNHDPPQIKSTTDRPGAAELPEIDACPPYAPTPSRLPQWNPRLVLAGRLRDGMDRLHDLDTWQAQRGGSRYALSLFHLTSGPRIPIREAFSFILLLN